MVLSAGRIVGVATLLTLGEHGIVTDGHTLKEQRGQGIASTLLSRLVEHAARAALKHVLLEMRQGNPAAALYESLGFQPQTAFYWLVRESR